MSQTGLDDITSAASSGFWEIGNYKANVQRIAQGSEQLEDISRFIKDRISIENSYAKHLERWNEEMASYSDKYLREGAVKSSFDMFLEESRELSKAHQAVKERFNDEVLKTIELFKRDNFHKSTFRGFKEVKEIEDEFEKAQKQWKKLFERVETTKRQYHSLARAEKSAYIQFMNSKADTSIADSANEKCKERFEKCQEELKKAKSNYEQQVNEITAYNNIYMENMAFVFEKCQRMEMKRLRFVIEMLSGMQKIAVDLLNPPKLVQLHAKLRQHFMDTTDATIGADLKRWSQKHGIDAASAWPQFEEYKSEFRHIHSGGSAKSAKQRQQQEMAVVLTKRVMKTEDSSVVEPSPQNGQQQHQQRGSAALRSRSQQPGSRRENWSGTASSQNSMNSEPASSGFDGEEVVAAATTTNNGGGKIHEKQNSIGSQQSRTASSKASSSSKNHSRAQSEKPTEMRIAPPQQRQIEQPMPSTTKAKQQRAASSASGGSTHSHQQQHLDPLATAFNAFPMVTPQKGGNEEDGNNSNKMGAADIVREKFRVPSVDFGGQRNGGGKTVVVSTLLQQHKQQLSIARGQEPPAEREEKEEQKHQQQSLPPSSSSTPPPMPVGPARALYDYKPFEDDEIQLIKGEVLEVLSGPDHLGWCLGVKRNKERGLFPAAYVCPLIQFGQ